MIGLFCAHHSICLNIGFCYGIFVWKWCVFNLSTFNEKMVLQFYEKVQKQPLIHSCTELSQPQFVPVSIVKWVKRNEKFRSSRSQMFFKIGVLKIFVIFTGKRLCWSLFLKRLQHRCFPVNIVKFFKKVSISIANLCHLRSKGNRIFFLYVLYKVLFQKKKVVKIYLDEEPCKYGDANRYVDHQLESFKYRE